MNYLQYTSKEMFSSTELIRKSKMIFEKINKHEIEKAIILRDGKPSFMLLDFETYEKLMQEYMQLKTTSKEKIMPKVDKEVKSNSETITPSETKIHKITNNPKTSIEEIDENELKKAFEDIDNINFSSSLDNDAQEVLDEVYIEERPIEKNDESLKDFWD
ncbi:hypothetical protein AMRN_0055 [Malaciobacter marinus]|uniref:Antitoxin n=1 Tax=Malaciobacter marinus TaxID=505249 RepID=A0A347TGX8_9BACT|nr:MULTISPECIES: hypothetical protein [Malaciobacter]AXX85856.1 hypothetical protein AMRN_0055 [Malaciobacter marinus]PHO12835.1 hypothetical protein CPG38_06090 [Malaciobacter marinus]PHO15021.1 hypothetical protein CPH92_09205 [Malaciobacter marinus]RYA24345.1 hypothetical protein CRU96_03605 [Malaciobacter halophilus]